MADGTIKQKYPTGYNSIFKYVEYSYKWTNTVASGGVFSIAGTSFNVSTPSGYTPAGIVKYTSGNIHCVLPNINASAVTGNNMQIRNAYKSDISDKTAIIGILYVRTNFLAESTM